VCDLPGARCDIDEPEDLALLLQNNRRDIAINTRNFLMASGVAERVAAMQSAAINGGERRVCA
jgi:2-phospho-L-lactate guanylyltransferase (CobY/MobA/RfbA family)